MRLKIFFFFLAIPFFSNMLLAQKMDPNETFRFAISTNPLSLLLKQMPVALDIRTGRFFSCIRYNKIGKSSASSFQDGNLEDSNPDNPQLQRPVLKFTKGYQIGYTAKCPISENLSDHDNTGIYFYAGPEIMHAEVYFDNPNTRLIDIASNSEYYGSFQGKASINYLRGAIGAIIGKKRGFFMDCGGTFGLRFRDIQLTGKTPTGATQSLSNTYIFDISKPEWESTVSGSFYGYFRIGLCF
jgi:hypothetical protein